MAIGLSVQSRLGNNLSIFNKLSYRPSCCHAKMVTMQSGKTNFYEVLSLDSKDVGLREIKKAYRCKALKFHPDICQADESTTRFLEIQQAYETLSDPVARETYDYELGLVNSAERKYGKRCMTGKRAASGLSKEVWERQLHGLRIRSTRRMEKKRNA